jgi:hypothetical protein
VQKISLFYRQEGQMASFSNLQCQHMCPETTIHFASRISGT